MPKSLLFTPSSPFHAPHSCAAGRQEVRVDFHKDARRYSLVIRDKIVVEDPYIVLVKAAAFAVQQNEPYMGRVTSRAVRDFLIKGSVG